MREACLDACASRHAERTRVAIGQNLSISVLRSRGYSVVDSLIDERLAPLFDDDVMTIMAIWDLPQSELSKLLTDLLALNPDTADCPAPRVPVPRTRCRAHPCSSDDDCRWNSHRCCFNGYRLGERSSPDQRHEDVEALHGAKCSQRGKKMNVKETDEQQKLRFQIELEFVQCLANPNYLNFLAQRGYLKQKTFVNYLNYLQYWKKPEYSSTAPVYAPAAPLQCPEGMVCVTKDVGDPLTGQPSLGECIVDPHARTTLPSGDGSQSQLESLGSETVFLPGGCILTKEQYKSMEEFKQKPYITGCTCKQGSVECKISTEKSFDRSKTATEAVMTSAPKENILESICT
ncbi:hypothetical protein HPB49_025550 [Dermacentor silvarum]|uniref:Uncharacterized protein n=1 Tax=Dermacentor silvarum TaxID=543639 RepID=A0ACB8D8R6_DERSI|nr:hypothetical protein HPB49_025550 [Dermacentor silvarum]